jgi:hypothetical protein
MRLLPASGEAPGDPYEAVGEPEYGDMLALLREFVALPLSGGGLMVRAVLPPTDGSGDPRVVLWDGRDRASAVGFDVAVAGEDSAYVQPEAHLAALRTIASEYRSGSLTDGRPPVRDPFGVPVYDVRERSRQLTADYRPTPTDLLRSTLAPLTSPPAGPTEEGGFFTLWGFLLTETDTARFYGHVPGEQPGSEVMVAIDVRLRDSHGRVRDNVGLLDTHLPTLARTRDLARFRVTAGDGYCDSVHDLTDWLDANADPDEDGD